VKLHSRRGVGAKEELRRRQVGEWEASSRGGLEPHGEGWRLKPRGDGWRSRRVLWERSGGFGWCDGRGAVMLGGAGEE
jgi:hypothetical protein